MARRGKKIDDKTREEIRAYYASCGNKKETARKFGVSHSTVKKIVEESDDFDQLRAEKVADHIEKAWYLIDLYMNQLMTPEMLKKATPHSAAVVIGTMWDKIHKKRELDLKEQENELRRREIERKENGPTGEEVAEVVGKFVEALTSDPQDIWQGVEDEPEPEDMTEGDDE
jgi:hypothetical protein